MQATSRSRLQSRAADDAAVPHRPQPSRTLVRSWSRGHRCPSPSPTSMAARRSTSPSPSSFVHEVDHRPFAQGQQHPFVGGREVDEPGEGTEFIAARPDPGRLGSLRLACGQLAEVVASVQVAIRSGRPHGGDRAEPDGTRALQTRLECRGKDQVPATAERQPGQQVHLGVGERRAEFGTASRSPVMASAFEESGVPRRQARPPAPDEPAPRPS